MPSPFETDAGLIPAAAATIRGHWHCDATAAVVLGTGLGELADEVQSTTTIDYRDIPGFPHSTALAHKGRLVCGEFCGAPVMMLQGRCHLYEGYSFEEITLPVRVLAALGIKTLILTNAAGGLNPRYSAGDIMLLDSHINLMNMSVVGTLRVPLHASRGTFYDLFLAETAAAAARRQNFVLHRGTYVAVTGPSYETRAEYRAFRRIGGDCVGMSTVPEALAAAACGLKILALSTVTNVAIPDAPKTVSAEEVVQVASIARPRMGAIISSVVGNNS